MSGVSAGMLARESTCGLSLWYSGLRAPGTRIPSSEAETASPLMTTSKGTQHLFHILDWSKRSEIHLNSRRESIDLPFGRKVAGSFHGGGCGLGDILVPSLGNGICHIRLYNEIRFIVVKIIFLQLSYCYCPALSKSDAIFFVMPFLLSFS